MQLVRYKPQKLTRIEEGMEMDLYEIQPLTARAEKSAALTPIEESKQQLTQDPIAMRLFVIAFGCLGAVGLVIIGLLIGRTSTSTPTPTSIPVVPSPPQIVVVPAPAPTSGSKCLAFCSQ